MSVGRKRVVNHLPRFSRNLDFTLDRAFKEASQDIIFKAKMRAPYSGTKKMRKKAGKTGRGTGGHLRQDSKVKRLGMHKWQVRFDKEYAGAQEAGHAGKRYFRNYTTPGTGAHYLEDSGDEVMHKMYYKIVKHARRTRV